ncbi:substrate-binding domain-containing protein [Amycolatopsis nigrescens]|uniref:substrate-binding domain-containing protein n=1 Tax=Amycolatopsis nigrescens TaxID=381445 RepID=UPI0003A9BB29|nr:substrate-binding domain-containing protein [Amycolatopsis nigrescens]
MRARTTRLLGVAAMAAGASLVLTGTASAVEGPNGKQEVIAAAGSDTTQDVTAAIFANANSPVAQADWNLDPDNYVNVPPTPTSGFPVPGDEFCAAKTYGPGGTPAPNGSSAGKNALKASADAGDGCIDIARSSSGRSASDPASFQFYGFAKDGVSWATSTSGPGAGAALSLTQLRDIYTGAITNWNQVGGANATINRYLPQPGSGTRSFFTGTVLGFEPAAGSYTEVQENDATAVDASGITPFSIAQFIAQGNGVVTDKRNGFDVRALSGAGYDGAPYGTSAQTGKLEPTFADAFRGARTVYHILDTRSRSYEQAKNAVGFDLGGPSPLCNGELGTTLSENGFKPLAADGNGVTCTLS